MTGQPRSNAAAARLVEPLGLYRPRVGGASNQSWMVTFTDLIALMLTFFVLVFSMSSLDEVRWQNLVDSFSEGLDVVREQKVPVPRETLNIERVTQVPGNNLEYLYSLLREHMSASPSLAARSVVKQPDRLILGFTAADFFDYATSGADRTVTVPPVLTSDGKQLLLALSGLLQTIDHRVEVIGFASADGGATSDDSWTRAAALSLHTADALRDAGYRGRMQVLGSQAPAPSSAYPGEGGAASGPDNQRIDIVIQADRGEDRP